MADGEPNPAYAETVLPGRVQYSDSDSDSPIPNVTSDILQGPAPASSLQESSAGNGNMSDARPPAPVKFKMKRTGTNGLPPGHSIPNGNTAFKPSLSSSVVLSLIDGFVGHLDGITPRRTPKESSLDTATRISEPSSPLSTPRAQLNITQKKTESRQSIAMKSEDLEHMSTKHVC